MEDEGTNTGSDEGGSRLPLKQQREIVSRIEEFSDKVNLLVSKRSALVKMVKKLKDKKVEECIKDRLVATNI